jgi:hypothetical protein
MLESQSAATSFTMSISAMMKLALGRMRLTHLRLPRLLLIKVEIYQGRRDFGDSSATSWLQDLTIKLLPRMIPEFQGFDILPMEMLGWKIRPQTCPAEIFIPRSPRDARFQPLHYSVRGNNCGVRSWQPKAQRLSRPLCCSASPLVWVGVPPPFRRTISAVGFTN